MSYLYLVDYSSKLGFSENCLVVKKGTEIYERVPIETLEEVSVYGNCQITTQCIHECIKKSIPIIYYSAGGKYLGWSYVKKKYKLNVTNFPFFCNC